MNAAIEWLNIAGQEHCRWNNLKGAEDAAKLMRRAVDVRDEAAAAQSDRQAGKFKCNACEDSGWLWDGGPNHRVPCDVCEAGPAWLNAQMTQADRPGAE